MWLLVGITVPAASYVIGSGSVGFVVGSIVGLALFVLTPLLKVAPIARPGDVLRVVGTALVIAAVPVGSLLAFIWLVLYGPDLLYYVGII